MRGPKLRRRVASPTSFERVPPLDPGKAEKIRFGRVNDAPGFYGKRGQVSVGGQVSTFPFGTQKAEDQFRVAGPRVDYRYDPAAQPRFHMRGRLVDRHGIGKHTRIGP